MKPFAAGHQMADDSELFFDGRFLERHAGAPAT